MSKNLTISLPDEFKARLDIFKKDIKISKVCYEALRVEVEKREAIKNKLSKKGGIDLDAVIEKVQKEKDESEKDLFDLGYEVGYHDAGSSVLSFDDFKQFEEMRDSGDFDPDYFNELCGYPANNEELREVLSMGDDDRIKFQNEFLNTAGRKFLDGYILGVQAVWAKIKENLA